ncbi:MAG: ABC transporter ATP-binding protein [Acidimicrobiales bacterium]
MAPTSLLSIVDVTVRFGGLLALDSVSLSVEPNEIVGVIGPNGAGKTTLFNVACGFVAPTSGHLEIAGKSIRRLRPHRLRSLGISRTLQGVGLFKGLTVLENVMLGAKPSRGNNFFNSALGLGWASRAETRLMDRAMALLEDLRIAEVAHRTPSALPYALQKRTSIARSLISDPQLLLLDEPASGLSEAEMDELANLLRGLGQRMGVLLVEHHMDLVMSVCQRLVVLDFGRVISTGSPEQVQADPVVTKAYLGEDVTTLEASGQLGLSDA